ncbi:MAG: hypothetical protein U5R06_02045 [candidate division KSB1 bacterium]|nr:hypothetical protein [candidate division KSB1 bacterium]
MSRLVEKLKIELSLFNYSERTITIYSYHVARFLKTIQKTVESVTLFNSIFTT